MSELANYRDQFNCSFPQAKTVFEACITRATQVLTTEGISLYLEGASRICRMGRGVEPVLVFLEEAPEVVNLIGEASLQDIIDFTFKLNKSPNSKAIVPFLQSLSPIAQRLESQ